MNKNLQEKLINAYPWFFEACKSEPKRSMHSCMYLFGFECGDGWYKLLYDLFTELSTDVQATKIGSYPQVSQIKEKFGGLRFYVTGATDNQYKIISKYEKLSYCTCETCGEKGKLRNRYGWYTVACKRCFTKQLNSPRYQYPGYWHWYKWNLQLRISRKLETLKYYINGRFRNFF